VCLLVTTMSCAKTDEPIEMPFVLWARVGLRNHVLDPDPNRGGGYEERYLVEHREYPACGRYSKPYLICVGCDAAFRC